MDEREFELINIIGAQLSSSQRDLSERMDLSLGMTNMLIRRLITKGYIRIQQLNKKKVEYILTPKGFTEKMRKSVNYTMKTINSISSIRNRLLGLLKNLYQDGIRKFYILGGADLAGLIEMTMRENFPQDFQVVRVNEIPEGTEGVLLLCQENMGAIHTQRRVLNVIEELAKDPVFFNHGFELVSGGI